ncbi:MAG: 5-(carboxyamino)imidazole ribonucleotide mutase [Bacillota bacterium]
MDNPAVLIVMGSDSDLPVAAKAAELLEAMQVPCEVTIASAHRTPQLVAELAAGVRERGIKVVIAAAGGAAHLAGFFAAHTTVPVIGLPISNGPLRGQDALLATVQMPPGVPVATVAIDGAQNAALLACQILATGDALLAERLAKFRAEMAADVAKKADKLASMGYQTYCLALRQVKKP